MAHRASDAPKRKVIDDNSDDEIDEALFATAQQHAATSTTTIEHNDDEGADDDVDDKLAVRRIAKPALKDDADLQAAHADFESVLRLYYQMLFPFKPMYDWLSYGDAAIFSNRELSYTLMVSGDEIYARYKSWPDPESFAASISQLCPIKIDIGAIYPCPPEDRSTIGAQFQPLSKELVFDIDMTDYDKSRFCCSGANICHRCWVLMTAAIQITDKRLKYDFGFQHVLWIYSGRRGVHCWVSDERARLLTTSGRAAVVDYLSMIGEKSKDEAEHRVVQLPKRLHPMVADVCEIAREPFEAYIEAQELLEHPERFGPLLQMLPSPETRAELTTSWTDPNNYTDTRTRWQQLKATVERDSTKNGATKATYARAPHVVKEIMLAYVYPRYDAAVTRGFNHLLKSPFVVHPKTGRVCVPIDAARAEQFDPLAVPTVLQLIAQIDDYDKQHGGGSGATPHWQKTALAPYHEYFEAFLRGVQKSTRAERLRDQQAKQEPLDF